MAKIKSTLDIVLERTRGLSLSEEQKAQLKHKECRDKARAWVQRYLDDAMGCDELSRIFVSERSQCPKLDAILTQELAGHLVPQGDNRRVLEAFETVLGIAADVIRQKMAAFQKALEDYQSARVETLRDELERDGIGGPAVRPNPLAEETWKDQELRLFREHLGDLSGTEGDHGQ